MPPPPLHPPIPAPAIWLVALVAVAVALLLWPLQTPEMTAHFLPSLATIRTHGVAPAFAETFSYLMPGCLYLLALALSVHRLLRTLGVSQRTQWTIALLALPSIALNTLLSGEGDALYVAACVVAVAMALEHRHLAMFAWCGIAVALDAHAALVAPFFLALAIRRRVPFGYWLAAPAALVVITTPALIAGWPPADIAAIYFPQPGRGIVLNAPSIWSLAGAISPEHAPILFGLALATAFAATAAYVAQLQVAHFDKAGLVGMAALAALLTAGLLPGMHARAFLLADILIVAFAISRGTRSAFTLAALVQLGSTAAILGGPGPGTPMVAIGAVCMIAATWIAARPLIAPHANDNRDGSHRIPAPHGLRGTLSFDMVSAPVAGPRGE